MLTVRRHCRDCRVLKSAGVAVLSIVMEEEDLKFSFQIVRDAQQELLLGAPTQAQPKPGQLAGFGELVLVEYHSTQIAAVHTHSLQLVAVLTTLGNLSEGAAHNVPALEGQSLAAQLTPKLEGKICERLTAEPLLGWQEERLLWIGKKTVGNCFWQLPDRVFQYLLGSPGLQGVRVTLWRGLGSQLCQRECWVIECEPNESESQSGLMQLLHSRRKRLY